MKKYKSVICVVLVAAVFSGLTLWVWISPSREFSDSERRKLQTFPEFSAEALVNGSFMTNFEGYTQDQFPARDSFRTLKALSAYYMLSKLDNNGIFLKDGYAAKLEYPFNRESAEYAAARFGFIYESYIADKGGKVYFSLIPDKNYYLSQSGTGLRMDYESLFAVMKEKMSYARYIDITDTLSLSDYYKTDTHWRQEKLIDTAGALAEGMGVSLKEEYTVNALERPFYGVYYGQSALPLPPETVYYLTSPLLSEVKVTNWETNKVGEVYDMEKAQGKDPYEMFLSGSVSLLTLENPNSNEDRELIVFRDSFASSIAPLLVEGYSKITLVDIRYLRTDYLDKFIDFENKDVLFLYSTLVLNNSETLT